MSHFTNDVCFLHTSYLHTTAVRIFMRSAVVWIVPHLTSLSGIISADTCGTILSGLARCVVLDCCGMQTGLKRHDGTYRSQTGLLPFWWGYPHPHALPRGPLVLICSKIGWFICKISCSRDWWCTKCPPRMMGIVSCWHTCLVCVQHGSTFKAGKDKNGRIHNCSFSCPPQWWT